MHQPIRDNLEEYLKGAGRNVPQAFHAHLAACENCAAELQLLETQSKALRSLHCDQTIEPRAGFYARVMDRIEKQGPASIWSILLEPSFGRRLAIASFALVLLLGTYLVTTERSEPSVASTPVVVTDYDAVPQPADGRLDSLQQQRDRDAVLVNLASYHE